MREALARSDFDAVRRSPAPAAKRRAAATGGRAQPRTPASKPGVGAVAGRLASHGLALLGGLLLALAGLAFRTLQRWPVSVIGGLAVVALSAAIIVNAVSMQEGPHPSPLFGGDAVEWPAAPKAAAPKAVVPAPAPRSAGTPAAPVVVPVARPADKEPAAPQASAPPAPVAAANDPIAHLLATGAPPAAAKAGNSGVMGVQKALVKLGYDITPDGLSGPATRQAISAFEKLEGLPLTGDPANAAMRKALAVASGITLD